MWWIAFCIGFFAFLILSYRRVMEFIVVFAAGGAFVKVADADVARGEGVVGDKLLPFKPFCEQFLLM